MDSATADLKRGNTWDDSETRTLLGLWGEEKTQEELDSAIRNGHVFTNMARKLSLETGVLRTPQECRQRIKTLKKSYFVARNGNKRSGRGRSTCRYYELIDSVLGCRPSVAPTRIIDTLQDICQAEDVELEERESPSKQDDLLEHAQTSESHPDPDLPTFIHRKRTERKIESQRKSTATCSDPCSAASSSTNSVASQSAASSSTNSVASQSANTSSKKRKREDAFLDLLKEQQRDFFDHEEKRWQREKEAEEKTRKEEREHELRLFSMIGNMFSLSQNYNQSSNTHSQYSCQQGSASKSESSYGSGMGYLRMLSDDYNYM